MSDVWDNLSDYESERRHERVTAVRSEMVTAWPFLASADDRQDFATRLELIRPKLLQTAARFEDDEVTRQVEASFVNDFEVLFQAKTAAMAKVAAAKRTSCPICHAGPDTDDHMDAEHPDAFTDPKFQEAEKSMKNPWAYHDAAKTAAPKRTSCPTCHNGPDTDEHMEEHHSSDTEKPRYWDLDGFGKEPWSYYDGDKEKAKQANRSPLASGSTEREDRADSPFAPRSSRTSAKSVYDHIDHFRDWAKKNNHNADDLSTLRLYEKTVPGVGRASADKIADQYHLEDSGWRSRTASFHVTAGGRIIDLEPEAPQTVKAVEASRTVSAEVSPQSGNEGGSEAHEAASNLFEPEYDGGLPCTQGGCNWSGYTEAQRDSHVKSRHRKSKVTAAAPPAHVLPAPAYVLTPQKDGTEALTVNEPRLKGFLSRLFKRAGEVSNILETCPICGKQIPAHEMLHHIQKDHPHQAPKMDDISRSAAATDTPPMDAMPKPSTMMPSTDSAGATPLPSPGEQSANPSMSAVEDVNEPNNMVTARRVKIAAIAKDVQYMNPGLTESQAIHLATDVVRRYPDLLKESRGGADYIDGESMSKCPQCAWQAYSEVTHHCHNCGAVFA